MKSESKSSQRPVSGVLAFYYLALVEHRNSSESFSYKLGEACLILCSVLHNLVKPRDSVLIGEWFWSRRFVASRSRSNPIYGYSTEDSRSETDGAFKF